MSKHSSLRKPALVLGAFILLFASTTALLRSSASEAPAPAPTSTAMPQGSGSDVVPTLRVFVHPEDIYPDVVTLAPGQIRLRAENETLGDVSLVVERINQGQSSQAIAQISTVNKAKRAEQPINLTTGQYVYYEQSRPDVRGKIIVTGN
jgi:hypothetical protein